MQHALKLSLLNYRRGNKAVYNWLKQAPTPPVPPSGLAQLLLMTNALSEFVRGSWAPVNSDSAVVDVKQIALNIFIYLFHSIAENMFIMLNQAAFISLHYLKVNTEPRRRWGRKVDTRCM